MATGPVEPNSERSDKNNCQYLEHYRGIPEHYRAIIWEFENSIMGQNFSIIYKCLVVIVPEFANRYCVVMYTAMSSTVSKFMRYHTSMLCISVNYHIYGCV